MGKKILVVDDEEDVIMMIEARLEAEGYDIVTAQNGLQALEKIKAEPPDLIITDVLMPEMDGFTLYKELKKNPDTEKIPVLVLTARGKMEDTFRVLGADDFIPKPFDSKELTNKVKESLAKFLPPPKPSGSTETPADQPQAEKETLQKSGDKEEVVKSVLTGECKVLLLGNTKSIVDNIADLLKKKNCQIKISTQIDNLEEEIGEFKPDLAILDVLVNNKPANGIINLLRKAVIFKRNPIIIYTFLDKDNLDGHTIGQRAVQIDQAKTACVDSGAAESIGGFDERALMSAVEKYL